MNEEAAGQGEQGTASVGIILGPGEGRTIPGTDTLTLKATSEQTGGSIGVLEATSPPGYGPPRHLQPDVVPGTPTANRFAPCGHPIVVWDILLPVAAGHSLLHQVCDTTNHPWTVASLLGR